MKHTIKSTRVCQGNYLVTLNTLPGKEVEVYAVPGNPAYGESVNLTNWIARAAWRNDTYTDPLSTKRQAMECAKDMLFERAHTRE